MLQQKCTPTTCPEMKTGEWKYPCFAHSNDIGVEASLVILHGPSGTISPTADRHRNNAALLTTFCTPWTVRLRSSTHHERSHHGTHVTRATTCTFIFVPPSLIRILALMARSRVTLGVSSLTPTSITAKFSNKPKQSHHFTPAFSQLHTSTTSSLLNFSSSRHKTSRLRVSLRYIGKNLIW